MPLRCPECGLMGAHTPACGWSRLSCVADQFVITPDRPDQASTHRIRSDMAAVQLTNQLRRHVAAGCASPNDIQLLAALDRWAAGELV